MPPPAFTAARTGAPESAPHGAEHLPRHAALAVASRDGLAESIHYGSVIATAPDGSTLAAAGDPRRGGHGIVVDG